MLRLTSMGPKPVLWFALAIVTCGFLTGCYSFDLPRTFTQPTPNLHEERKGILPGATGAGVARTLSRSAYSVTNVHWAEFLGGIVGSEVRAHPELLVTELQNKGINAFFLGESLVIALHTDDYFYPGSFEVRHDVKVQEALSGIANLLAHYSNQPIYVEGYNDTSYAVLENLDAAEARANSLSAYMWAHGVEPSRFKVITHGGESLDQTLASMRTASGLSDNRQVIFSTKADPQSFTFDWPFHL